MKKATECDGVPAETWKMLVAKDKGIEIVTDLFNRIKSKWKFPCEWKITLPQPIYQRNGNKMILETVVECIYHQLLWKYMEEY